MHMVLSPDTGVTKRRRMQKRSSWPPGTVALIIRGAKTSFGARGAWDEVLGGSNMVPAQIPCSLLPMSWRDRMTAVGDGTGFMAKSTDQPGETI